MKKLHFASLDDTGCGHYRSFLPHKYMLPYFPGSTCEHGFRIGSADISAADVIIIQRHADAFFVDWIPHARALGKIVLYDLDDSFWHLPSHSPVKSVYNKKIVAQIERIIAMCNGVIVSTHPLAHIVERFNPNVLVIPNLVEIPTIERKPYTDRLKIGWGGSSTHRYDFSSKVVSALKHCQLRYDAQLVFLGYLPQPFADDKDVIHIPACPAPAYLHQLFLADLEIAVAPLENNYFNECKSNLKFLEYSICGTATIASDAYPYKNTIRSDDTGFVIGKNGWRDALESMCEDPTYRNRIQGNARDFVHNNFTWVNRAKDIAAAYLTFIEAVR